MYSDGVRQTFVHSVAGTDGAGVPRSRVRDAMGAGTTAMRLPAVFVVSII